MAIAPERTTGPGDVLARVEEHNGEHTRAEWLDYRVQVTPWEIEKYLPLT